jgi:ubiquinone/menaquinone biosynthesis C-methylase UbiE
MTDYIMGLPSEPERIRSKTNPVLLDHHLTWAGLCAGETFVDFGCASGEVVRAASTKLGHTRIVGLDGDARMLEYAAEASDRLGLRNIEYLEASIAGPNSTHLPDSTFDHAWTRFFLEYQKDPTEVVGEMVRVVRPGGKVTLIDIDGNCLWHHPMSASFRADIEEVMEDLRTAGFDPHAGARLTQYASKAGLVDIRQQVEPYHWIIGRPDDATAAAWTTKLQSIKHTYLTRVAPHKDDKSAFFDDFLALVMADETMTWSLAHLVQGTKAI